ncbi:MAG: adenylate/guanylate cyclase domain-containing protein [Acidimicrobiia bacterium]
MKASTVELPSGLVTFLFTDIEGSTRLWEEHPDGMRAALAHHDELIRGAVEAQRGYVVKTTGDGVHAAFPTADDGVRAAIVAQRALAGQEWGETGELRVRMGLHTGAAEVRDGDYYGSSLNRAARLMGVAHGGQIVCSHATADLARDSLTEGVVLTDLGDHRLRDLSRPERVFQIHAPDLAGSFAPLRSVDSFPGNLPLQVSSFIGREQEIAQIVAALHEARVVTLTGVGGVGKTRLALQVAAEVLPRFREGAWLVELAPVRDPDGVVDAFAIVFGVTPRAGQRLTDALVEFLATKQLLLVVDNCEHLLDPVADLVDEIGRSCPAVVVLATSREGLALVGERILAVPSLGAPPSGAELEAIVASDAVQLFVDRARGADAAFAVGRDNAEAVVRVCRRLDGVPLAIELAAARVSAMNPMELAAALDRRFEVLAGGRRGALKRQQTLRATIDWSYDLLDEPQQRLLARLAVFTGSCTREAAEAVCAGEPIDTRAAFELLAGLVDRSLVVADRGGLDTRYRLLETIREYGEERLVEHDETAMLRYRHAHYFTDYALRCYEGQWGPDQIEWGTRMTADGENILAAFTYAVDTGNIDLAAKLLDSTNFNAAQTGFALTLPVEPVLAMAGVEQHPGYPVVLLSAAFAASARGEQRLAQEYGDAALDAERVVTVARPYTTDLTQTRCNLLATIALSAGEWEKAAMALLEGAELARNAGRTHHLAVNLGGAANALGVAGRYADAVPVATEGLALARAAGMPTAINFNLLALAHALAGQDPERARALLHEASHSDVDYETYSELIEMTFAATTIGDWPLTARFATRSIRHLHWINQRPYLGGILNLAARVLADTDPDGSATVQGAAHILAVSAAAATTGAAGARSATAPTGDANRGGLIVETRRETTRRLADTLGDDRLRALRDHGATMDTDQAVAFTLTHLDAYLRDQDQPAG